jgi:ABC-type proline/glycine betaine transport system ATPase subunit
MSIGNDVLNILRTLTRMLEIVHDEIWVKNTKDMKKVRKDGMSRRKRHTLGGLSQPSATFPASYVQKLREFGHHDGRVQSYVSTTVSYHDKSDLVSRDLLVRR